MSKSKNIERLKFAQELLERKKPPSIDAPDLLSIVERKNRAARSNEMRKLSMYPLPIEDISMRERKRAKTIYAKKGTYVKCPKKKEIRIKKTRLT